MVQRLTACTVFAEELSSIPSTHDRWLTIAFNSSSWTSDYPLPASESTALTCIYQQTYIHAQTQADTHTHT